MTRETARNQIVGRLSDVEPPTDDTLLFYVSLDARPTSEELREFDRTCRETSKFDGWDAYAQEIDGRYIFILANRRRRL